MVRSFSSEVVFAIMFYCLGYQYAPHSSVPRNFNNDEQVSDYSASSFAYESGDNVVLCCLFCVLVIGPNRKRIEHASNVAREETKTTFQSAK